MLEQERPARVMVVDDHRTFADLLALALTGEPDLECVGAAYSAEGARALAADLRPDVVLMDVNLGADDGLDLTRDLVRGRPDLRVVVLTAHADMATMRRSASSGACAFLPKDGELSDLLNIVRNARPGGLVVHHSLLQALIEDQGSSVSAAVPRPVLRPQEQRVLQLLAEGRNVRAISRELQISVNTCRGYVKALLSKLDAHSQLEAVVIAGMHGLVDAPQPR